MGKYPVVSTSRDRPVLSDKHDSIYDRLRELEAVRPYAQRMTDIGVCDVGLAYGIKTCIFITPTIYGVGEGVFNTMTIQVPGLVRRA